MRGREINMPRTGTIKCRVKRFDRAGTLLSDDIIVREIEGGDSPPSGTSLAERLNYGYVEFKEGRVRIEVLEWKPPSRR